MLEPDLITLINERKILNSIKRPSKKNLFTHLSKRAGDLGSTRPTPSNPS